MPKLGNGAPTSLRRLRPSRNLTDRAAADIAAEIRDGRLPPGARLPTEQEMMATLGVSRTVVREAVSALRAEGLVVTRQGSGAFVAEDATRVPFRIDPEGTIADALNVMELRLAIEVEAATLAAERATPTQIAAIMRAYAAMAAAIAREDAAVNEDFLFHRAIASATGNAQFPQFLEFLGRHVIPRQRVRAAITDPKEQREYLARIQREHKRIGEAIKARDPADARKAMRTHLLNSITRYRKLAERSRVG
jgi:GntR family transcriptional regulator, transcriptional repressor for pyruvate dehydrogenase complex